jgi:predicted transcriptional regulator YdeE
MLLLQKFQLVTFVGHTKECKCGEAADSSAAGDLWQSRLGKEACVLDPQETNSENESIRIKFKDELSPVFAIAGHLQPKD